MHVCVLHGSLTERNVLRRRMMQWKDRGIDVVLTTYSVVCSKHDAPIFKHLTFDCAVFDEGHMLKNIKSDRCEPHLFLF